MMKSTLSQTPRHHRHAFSLVEMLVVIAVIGILSAIAIPAINQINLAGDESKNKRNAQNISSITTAADAAGMDVFYLPNGTARTKIEVIDFICDSANLVSDPSSPFNGLNFSVPNMTADERVAVRPYLELQNATLQYDVTGGN